ncbi:hypothetical protein C9426_32685 [Serratia sp. S1B]|nr:hypothetical protein C9426_32685 [Serratia sp. S1B]
MVYVYLFEAKSIQTYLFRSGRLRDVIAASDRLDRLVDDNEESILYAVLKASDLSSDLVLKEGQGKPTIRFIRCKGGAFYAWSDERQALLALRSLWTLTVTQLLPSLHFADALSQGHSLQEAMATGRASLANDAQNHIITFPISTAICDHYQRSGGAAVPITPLAKRATMGDEETRTALDLDTVRQREWYQDKGLRTQLLYKFIPEPEELKRKVGYPINLEKFPFVEDDSKIETVVKDLALIHIDGNGLGNLLKKIGVLLKPKTDEQYANAMRAFSNVVAEATKMASQKATTELCRHLNSEDLLPMRPLVLGGDDITVLCRADLALGFSQSFCQEFEKQSETRLATFYQQYQLMDKSLPASLTASGGILYHKAGHPFTHSHHLVEGLCREAKNMTKQQESQLAALAFYRLSRAVADDVVVLRENTQHVLLNDQRTIRLAQQAYFIGEASPQPNMNKLIKLARMLSEPGHPLGINKWRQMSTCLALGDKAEADNIYQRAVQRLTQEQKENWETALTDCHHHSSTWYWRKEGQLCCLLEDLLVVARFQPQESAVYGDVSSTYKEGI